MRYGFTDFLLAAFLGSAITQQVAAANSDCAAENIVQACLVAMKPQLEACGPNEWACLCEQSNNILTCYNNCPNHPDRFGAQQTKLSYCNAASAYITTSTTTTAGQSATSASTSTSTGSGATTAVTSTGAAKTSSGSSAKESNAAAGVGVEGGSLLIAAVAGLMVL